MKPRDERMRGPVHVKAGAEVPVAVFGLAYATAAAIEAMAEELRDGSRESAQEADRAVTRFVKEMRAEGYDLGGPKRQGDGPAAWTITTWRNEG